MEQCDTSRQEPALHLVLQFPDLNLQPDTCNILPAWTWNIYWTVIGVSFKPVQLLQWCKIVSMVSPASRHWSDIECKYTCVSVSIFTFYFERLNWLTRQGSSIIRSLSHICLMGELRSVSNLQIAVGFLWVVLSILPT